MQEYQQWNQILDLSSLLEIQNTLYIILSTLFIYR